MADKPKTITAPFKIKGTFGFCSASERPKDKETGEEQKYTVSILVPKDDSQVPGIMKAIAGLAKQAFGEKLTRKGIESGELGSLEGICMKDGDGPRAHDSLAGCWVITGTSKNYKIPVAEIGNGGKIVETEDLRAGHTGIFKGKFATNVYRGKQRVIGYGDGALVLDRSGATGGGQSLESMFGDDAKEVVETSVEDFDNSDLSDDDWDEPEAPKAEPAKKKKASKKDTKVPVSSNGAAVEEPTVEADDWNQL